MISKKIVLKEWLIIILGCIIAYFLDVYFSKITPPHPNALIGFLKVFFFVYIVIFILRLLVNIIIVAIKGLKFTNKGAN